MEHGQVVLEYLRDDTDAGSGYTAKSWGSRSNYRTAEL